MSYALPPRPLSSYRSGAAGARRRFLCMRDANRRYTPPGHLHSASVVAGLLARESQLPADLPGDDAPVARSRQSLSAYRCGGSAGILFLKAPASLLALDVVALGNHNTTYGIDSDDGGQDRDLLEEAPTHGSDGYPKSGCVISASGYMGPRQMLVGHSELEPVPSERKPDVCDTCSTTQSVTESSPPALQADVSCGFARPGPQPSSTLFRIRSS